MKLYKVCGCIRDQFLGLESKDIDFTYVSTQASNPEDGFNEMTNYLHDNGFTIFLSTPECFTIRSKFPADHKYAGLVADFVLARKEVGYYEGTRRPILEIGTLEDDLRRRDFTVNAMAIDIDDDRLIDPFNGIHHLKVKILKTPVNPEITMMDDPLRLLRALRFSTS